MAECQQTNPTFLFESKLQLIVKWCVSFRESEEARDNQGKQERLKAPKPVADNSQRTSARSSFT